MLATQDGIRASLRILARHRALAQVVRSEDGRRDDAHDHRADDRPDEQLGEARTALIAVEVRWTLCSSCV